MFAKDDLDFIRRRLNGTIISYNDTPIYVVEVNRRGKGIFLQASNISTDEDLEVDIDDVDFTPVRLGYVNRTRRSATWLSRIPIRAWEQGLCSNHISSTEGHFDPVEERKNLYKTIKGDYPTIEKASKLMDKTAFARDFAILGSDIYYKDLDIVGSYQNQNIVLKDRYMYLREYIQEVAA
jgi:hypothetical protein